MSYTLIALDLDGTLLDSQHRVSPENAAAVQACLDRQIMIVIATGRLYASAGIYCNELGLTGSVITLNGAVIADARTGTMQAGHLLNEPTLQMVTDELHHRGIAFAIFGTDSVYALPDTASLAVLEGYGEPPAIIVPSINAANIPQAAKVLAFLREGPQEAELRERFQGPTDVVRTNAHFLEFLAPHVSKGAALSEIMAKHGIAAENVLAIGDSYNDLPMFDIAGMSVAMGGSDAPIQGRAKAVTTGCDESGVAEALRRFVLEVTG